VFAEDTARRIYSFVRNDIVRILVTPKRQERPAEVNPNRHQMEQHERDQEKANVFIFGRERSANKSKVNDPQINANGSNGLKMLSKIKHFLLGFPA